MSRISILFPIPAADASASSVLRSATTQFLIEPTSTSPSSQRPHRFFGKHRQQHAIPHSVSHLPTTITVHADNTLTRDESSNAATHSHDRLTVTLSTLPASTTVTTNALESALQSLPPPYDSDTNTKTSSTNLPTILTHLHATTDLIPTFHIPSFTAYIREALLHPPASLTIDYQSLCKGLSVSRHASEDSTTRSNSYGRYDAAGREEKTLKWGFWVTSAPAGQRNGDVWAGSRESRVSADPYGGLM